MSDATSPTDARMAGGRRHTARWVAGVVAIMLTGFIAVLATGSDGTTRRADSPLLGRSAPAFEAVSLDGETVKGEDFRGRWVLVNFFATWCVPCREEHPELMRFAATHQLSGDAAVVGVIFDDEPAAVRRFMDERGGSWPMLIDPKGRIAFNFGVSGVPESYLISPGGVVVAKVTGGVRAGELDALLAEAKQTGSR